MDRKKNRGKEEKKKNIKKKTKRREIGGREKGEREKKIEDEREKGKKQEKREKEKGEGRYRKKNNFDSNSTYETQPISITDSVNLILDRRSDIAEIKRFATKPGVIKTNDDFIAIVFKGVESSKSLDYFA